MVFWIGIVFALIFLSIGVKLGFYETWATLFNAAIAIYLALVLNPIAKELIPSDAHSSFDDALVMLGLAIGIFSIIHSIVYIFILSQFKISMSKLFDIIGAAGLGFLLGMLIWNFILILICSSPLAGNNVVKKIGIEQKNIQPNILYITRYTEFIHSFAGVKGKLNISTFLDEILNKYDGSKAEKTTPETTVLKKCNVKTCTSQDANNVEPNIVEPKIIEPNTIEIEPNILDS